MPGHNANLPKVNSDTFQETRQRLAIAHPWVLYSAFVPGVIDSGLVGSTDFHLSRVVP